MSATPPERAVIEAARSLVVADPYNIFAAAADTSASALVDALDALDAATAAGERDVPWTQVAEGDQLRSPVNGQFYPITATRKMQGDRVQVTVSLGKSTKTITRPTEQEPLAHIRRGATGQAIETLVCVLSSGEA